MKPNPDRARSFALAALGLALVAAPAASAQDMDPKPWSVTASTGAFDLCRSEAPDAAMVAERGEIWGWPRFTPYLEHPLGYRRDAGGESTRNYSNGDGAAYVELTVQSGVVTAAAPALIRYFRCNLATDQAIGPDLDGYFTGLYGPPATRTEDGAVWLVGPAGAAATDEAAVKALAAAGVGAKITRVELSRDRGLERAKLSQFENDAPPATP